MLNKNIQSKFEKKYFLFSTILLFFIFLSITTVHIFFTDLLNFNLILTTLISLLGTLLMLRALYLRHSILFLNRIYQKKVFFVDILYSIAISPIILFLYFVGGENLLMYSYLVSSIFAYFFYKSIK